MNTLLEDAEMLSVVDSDDHVVGTERRDKIHELGLRHRAVHVLIFNNNGDLFLQKEVCIKKRIPGCGILRSRDMWMRVKPMMRVA